MLDPVLFFSFLLKPSVLQSRRVVSTLLQKAVYATAGVRPLESFSSVVTSMTLLLLQLPARTEEAPKHRLITMDQLLWGGGGRVNIRFVVDEAGLPHRGWRCLHNMLISRDQICNGASFNVHPARKVCERFVWNQKCTFEDFLSSLCRRCFTQEVLKIIRKCKTGKSRHAHLL